MLVVTTTMRMVHRVHSNTTSTGPVVTLGFVLVVSTTSFQERLVDTTTTSDNTNGGTRTSADGLLGTTGKTYAGLVVIRRVANDGGVGSRSTGKGTTVTSFLLNVADDGTFGEVANREDVSDGQSGLLATVNESTGVHSFSSNEGLRSELVAVGVTENNTGQRSTTARIVENFLYNTPDVAITFGKVEGPKTGRVFVVVGMCFKDGMRPPLRSDNPTHLCERLEESTSGTS